MGMQKDHDLAHDFLLGPDGGDALRPARPDAVHLAQALWRGLDDIEVCSLSAGMILPGNSCLSERFAWLRHHTQASGVCETMRGSS